MFGPTQVDRIHANSVNYMLTGATVTELLPYKVYYVQTVEDVVV